MTRRRTSKRPGTQRKRMYEAPLHRRWAELHALLDAPLRKKYGRRSLPVRKGDTVRMMRGAVMVGEKVTRHMDAKVAEVDLKRGKIHLENVTLKNAKGKQVWVPIDPSNVVIVKLDLSDVRRRERLPEVKER